MQINHLIENRSVVSWTGDGRKGKDGIIKEHKEICEVIDMFIVLW